MVRLKQYLGTVKKIWRQRKEYDIEENCSLDTLRLLEFLDILMIEYLFKGLIFNTICFKMPQYNVCYKKMNMVLYTTLDERYFTIAKRCGLEMNVGRNLGNIVSFPLCKSRNPVIMIKQNNIA